MRQARRLAVAADRMVDPARASRLWLATAVASLWVVAVGSQVETGPTDVHPDLADLRSLLAAPRPAGQRRETRLFRLGRLWLPVQLTTAHSLPLPRQWIQEPWPGVPGEWAPFLDHLQPLSHAVIQKTYP